MKGFCVLRSSMSWGTSIAVVWWGGGGGGFVRLAQWRYFLSSLFSVVSGTLDGSFYSGIIALIAMVVEVGEVNSGLGFVEI